MKQREDICKEKGENLFKIWELFENMPMEDLISVNYSKITNCDWKICYLETSFFKIKISKKLIKKLSKL